MPQSKDPQFEETLKEILIPGSDDSAATAASPQPQPSPAETEKPERRPAPGPVHRNIETLVRIVAAVLALGLLLLFAVQIASR